MAHTRNVFISRQRAAVAERDFHIIRVNKTRVSRAWNWNKRLHREANSLCLSFEVRLDSLCARGCRKRIEIELMTEWIFIISRMRERKKKSHKNWCWLHDDYFLVTIKMPARRLDSPRSPNVHTARQQKRAQRQLDRRADPSATRLNRLERGKSKREREKIKSLFLVLRAVSSSSKCC